MYSFKNDYSEIAHPEILKTLLENCDAQFNGYGFDFVSERLEKQISEKCGCKLHLYFLGGGTITNMILIDKVLNNYQTVIAVDSGHINVHETGAVEASGHKIITVKGENGKITSQGIIELCNAHIDCHMVMPKMVYISNASEIGTIYTKKELEDIYQTCQEYNLKLFIDGARIGTALMSKNNDMTLKDIAANCDAFYIGGTKNGLPYGEALLIKDEMINQDFFYHLKNKGGMFAKTYVLALCFERLFKDDLFFQLANHSDEMAQIIYQGINKKENILYPVDANMLFVYVGDENIKKINKEFAVEQWGQGTIRIVTSFNTSKNECLRLVKLLNELM